MTVLYGRVQRRELRPRRAGPGDEKPLATAARTRTPPGSLWTSLNRLLKHSFFRAP